MHPFPPNLDPKIYNISSVIIGFALIDNFSATEQNAIGNWFITIGQILENNSAWQQLIEQRMQGDYVNINSAQYKKTGDPFIKNKAWMDSPSSKEMDQLKKTVEIMQEKLKNL